MRTKNKTPSGFAKNKEGVSPVIGVILMVAIMVILTAVIASFAMSYSAPEPAPATSLSEKVEGSSIYIYHEGGDPIRDAPNTLSRLN